MTAQVLAFLRRPAAPRDWSTQEIAEFYRVESALIQAGLRVTSERGLTDEGEPWFVFCREEDDEVIIHFARIDGHYLISAPAYCGTATGPDFRALMRGIVERHPVLQPQASRKNLFLHPSALLVLLVASALLKAGHAAEAAPAKTEADEHDGKVRHGSATLVADETMSSETQHETLVLAAVNAAFALPIAAEPATIVVSAPSHPQEVVADQPHERPAYPMLLDWLHGTEVVAGVVDTTLTTSVLSSSAAPSSPQALPSAPVMILAHQPDAISVVVPLGSVPVMPNFQSQDVFQGTISPAVVVPVPEIADYTHESTLFSISSIPKADLTLLQSLNVPDIVAYSATAPAALQSIVHAGTHTPVTHSDSSVAHSAGDASQNAAPVQGADASSSNQTPTVASTPGADPATTPSSPQHVASSAVSTIDLPSSSLSSVLTTVEQFQAIAADPVVLMTAHAAIFYDAEAVNNHYSQVQSITYDFGDGFTISVVGLPSELSHAGIHA